MIARRPGQGLPKQARAWSDLKAAYRFFSNSRVEPIAIGAPHRAWTRRQCVSLPIVLCVHDGSDLQGARIPGDQYVQQSSMAVTPEGQIIGLLAQRWYRRVQKPEGETQRQRQERWRESAVWPEAVEAIGPWENRLIHVADCAADDVRFMRACVKTKTGFVVRARFDRRLEEKRETLWPHLAAMESAGTLTVRIGAQRGGRGQKPRRGREAKLEVRFGTVEIKRPCHDSEPEATGVLKVQAVYLRELDPPQDVEPVDWMLLTSEKAESFDDACLIARYYQVRWVIEEWHRCLKEGCALEESQVNEAEDLERLAAVLSIVAVRILSMRDCADEERSGSKANDAEALKRIVPESWIVVVAGLYEDDPETLTPAKFWRNIARQGGWIGRKSDGRPGWKTIWRGWYDVTQMVQGAELMAKRQSRGKRCG